MQEYTIRPVGIVHKISDEESVIEVFEEHSAGLLRIEACEKLQILFWMHKLSEAELTMMQAHPMKDYDTPKRGVFALRSPMRPNPIGVTVVDFIKTDGNKVHVNGLDALDGSPVIDIKCAKCKSS